LNDDGIGWLVGYLNTLCQLLWILSVEREWRMIVDMELKGTGDQRLWPISRRYPGIRLNK